VDRRGCHWSSELRLTTVLPLDLRRGQDCLYGVWGAACGDQPGSVVAATVAHGVGVGEVGGTCQRMCWSGHACRGAPCL
jgi:hypothetical protein